MNNNLDFEGLLFLEHAHVLNVAGWSLAKSLLTSPYLRAQFQWTQWRRIPKKNTKFPHIPGYGGNEWPGLFLELMACNGYIHKSVAQVHRHPSTMAALLLIQNGITAWPWRAWPGWVQERNENRRVTRRWRDVFRCKHWTYQVNQEKFSDFTSKHLDSIHTNGDFMDFINKSVILPTRKVILPPKLATVTE